MKIVIVLCFLATFAIAVPVYQENVFESSLSNQPLSTIREKKSALPDITSGLSPEYGIEKIQSHSSKNLVQGKSVEAKSFRRPIIIKRKLGYHVYRDSDEEMAYAEPGEKCREQVKFKLCDHEPVSSTKNRNKSPTFKCMENYKTDNEMENSIKMAKQAVEYLQKDLKRMEKFSPKMANPHTEDIESNSGLHHDIEIAREALENIEQNFESVNSEVNRVNELQIPKSQNVERLSRWREAIENIHKNFEIVKNIEDAFQTDNLYSLFRSNNKKADESEEPTNTQSHFHVQNEFTNDNLEINGGAYNEDKILKSASNEDGIAQLTPKTENIDNIGKDVGYDMFISPTENRERKVQLHSDNLKSEIYYKDASPRSDASETEFTEQATNLPKVSIEYSPKNSNYLSEVPTNKEHEKTTNEYISDDYKLDIERHPEERRLQYSKSIPELPYDPMLSLTRLERIDNTGDQYAYKEEAGVRSSESQNEKLRLNEYREELKQASTGFNIENNSDDTTAQYFKSVPELQPYRVESLPLDNRDTTNDQHSYREDTSMRSSDSHNEKTQISENQEEHELLPLGLGIERLPEERIWQDAKSVPEPSYDPMLSTINEKVDKTDDQHGRKEEAGMRSSERQNEKLQLNEYREEPKQASTRLDIENSSDDTTAQFFKSVPELHPYAVESLPLDKVDTTTVQESYREEASMKSTESQNEKMQSSENQEKHEVLPTELGIERLPEKPTWQDAKSVLEPSYDPILSTINEKVDNTDDLHGRKEEAGMRSSESQNEKLQLNEYREEPKQASTKLDIENNSDDTTAQYFKSVPELQPYAVKSLPLDKVDTTTDQESYKEEASMRSSESQNEKMQLSKNQEQHELLPMGLGTKRLPEERIWQDAKSVPEPSYDPMLSTINEKIDNTDDQHGHKKEAEIRSSESQNEKLQLNEDREEPKQASRGSDIENSSDDTIAQYFKSVPELKPQAVESLLLDKGDTTNDQESHREEASMRSSESQNEKMQSSENQEKHEVLPTELGIERLPEKPTWQDAKSVLEPSYDPILSTINEKIDNTDDLHGRKEEAGMRSSESQNEKLQLNEYREEPKQASRGSDTENSSDDTIAQYFKAVPELKPQAVESLLLDKGDTTNDQESHREEASMRSSESQNEKMQSSENQEKHEVLPTELGIERLPEKPTWQDAKSVLEPSYDPILSTINEKVDNTDDLHGRKEEAGMRSSESQNEKLQLNEYREEPKQASTKLDIENNSDDTTAQYFKSVPELQPYAVKSLPLDKVDTTTDQESYKEEASMRSSESQNEKMQLSKNQEQHELLPMGLGTKRLPEERIWQDAKSVPEPSYDPMLSTINEKIDNTDDQHGHKKEAEIRSSESQNEKLQLNEDREEPKQASRGSDIENSSDDTIAQYFKSVPELKPQAVESLLLDKGDTTNDQESHREEASMRSSESQNEKMQSSENQEKHEVLPTELGIERLPEKPTWQDAKSVLEPSYDPILSTINEKVDNTDDLHGRKEEAGMRSSESQNEKLQLNEYREEPKQASTRLDIENSSDDATAQYFKSVPELQPYAIDSLPLDKVSTTTDQESYREEASMRSTESQNEKMKSRKNQEEHELLPIGLGIERLPEERIWQDAKSVPEPSYGSMLLTTKEEVDNTDDQHGRKKEAGMRWAESPDEKLQLNGYREEPKQASTGSDIENSSDDTTALYFKSVPELQPYSVELLPLDQADTTNDQESYREDASMRSSGNKNEKMQSIENQEEHELLPIGLGIERLPEERIWQDAKSVPEPSYGSMLLTTKEEVDNTDDQHGREEEAGMRWAEIQDEKLQLNGYREEPKQASTASDIENSSDDTTAQYFKSVPELQPYSVELLPLDQADTTNDQESYREEASMRSSGNKNEKMQSIENEEEHEVLPTELGVERLLEEGIWQDAKSVPEPSYDPMLLPINEKVDNTDDQHGRKEEAGMRSSESQNEKFQLNEYREEPKQASTGFYIENNSDDTRAQYFKSVPELQPYLVESLPLDNGDTTNGQQSYREEASMRSSGNKNEKMQSIENQEEHELLPIGLGIERLPEERIWQDAKSVPEPSYGSMLLTTKEEVDNTDDQHGREEETGMRWAEIQDEKLQLNGYREEPKQASTASDIENSSDDTTAQYFKSVPELQPYSVELLPLDQADTTNDQESYREEASMRSSGNKNEKMQSIENEEEHEVLPTELGVERLLEEGIWQDAKSVPEPSYDPMLLPINEKVDNTDDQHGRKEEAGMRSSESQNEKFQLNEYREEPKQASTGFYIENNSDDTRAQYFKSVPELQPYLVKSLPLDNGDTTNGQQSYREEASMRSSDSENEKMQSNNNQEVHEILPMELDFESHPKERKWQYSKSVPELPYDPMLSMPTEKVVNTIHQHTYKEKANMKSSDTENEKMQLNENQETHEPIMIQLDMANHPEDRKWPFSKSVPDFSYDPMVSMPSDNVEITNRQHFLKEGNMRLSQNQYERTPFDENHGVNEFLPTKPDDARLSQTQRERQQINFNHHLYEPHSYRFDIKSKLEDESPANKLRFNYIQNPTKEQTLMRLSQNQNENKEVQYPSTSLGLSNDMSGVENSAHVMNEFMHLSEAQPEQLHEIRDPMLRSSNERHHLSHNFNLLPEYKMLPQTSQFELSNGKNAINEHTNMRINQKQSRDPERMENQYKHNSLPMRWNTENQQDAKAFKSNLDFDSTPYKGNEFASEQVIPASKTVNTVEYRSRPQLYGDHILDDTPSSRWYQTVQHNDRFTNYYKSIPEAKEENTNPHFRNHLHRVALNHRLNDADIFTSHDFPSSRARLYDHMQKYHQEKPSNIDSSIEPSMHMNMGDPFAKSGTEFNNMYFNHPHGTARFVKGLPIAGVSPGAMGVFPTGNAGGCGIPLLLSCSPSVVSGSLARPNIAGPLLKSVDENFKYYIKRDAKNVADEPDIKDQKLSKPHSHGTDTGNEI